MEKSDPTGTHRPFAHQRFQPMSQHQKPTCSDYRQEMILLGLQRRLAKEDLSEAEKKAIKAEIEKLEQEIRLD